VRVEVKVPELSESITEGTLLEWRKKPGERVSRDENLVDLETDKVILEIPAPATGVLVEALRPDGATVKPQEVIAWIEAESGAETQVKEREAVPAAPSERPRNEGATVGQPVEEMPRELQTTTVPSPEGYAPAREPEKAVLQAPAIKLEVGEAEAPHAPSAAPQRRERREPLSRLRQRVAERLLQAQHEAAILTTFNEVDMQPVQSLRAQHKERFEQEHGVKLGLMSFFVKACVAALKQYPVLNASIDGNEIVYHDYHDIGIAVASERGLVVPVLKSVDCLSFADIERNIADFARRARSLELTLEDLSGGTFSITNGGVFGSLLSTPILNPPQSAILGMHRIQDRPVAEKGQVVIRPMMYLALSYDHRLIDGREAVLFLVAVKEALEDPGRLLLEL
jgi:2-oxoglutarate dehydrogenase E2 component (dihydrolipoamide succinyltransferase)